MLDFQLPVPLCGHPRGTVVPSVCIRFCKRIVSSVWFSDNPSDPALTGSNQRNGILCGGYIPMSELTLLLFSCYRLLKLLGRLNNLLQT
jgi:hypothetical protein